MIPHRPSLHRNHSSISYHPSTTHKPALPALNEALPGRHAGSATKKWFVLVEYGPELDSDHANGGTVLSFLQPTAHQQLVHTIPQLHLPSPIGLSLLLKIPANTKETSQGSAKVDDLIWPQLFAGFFLPDPGNEARGLGSYGHLPIAAHLLMKVDTRRARWYESWWTDPMIGSLERWVDLDRHRLPQEELSPVARPNKNQRRVQTTVDMGLPIPLHPLGPPSDLQIGHSPIEAGAPLKHRIPSPLEPGSPSPTRLPSPLDTRNKLSLTISVPSPAAWSNATSWGPNTTFSPYPPIEWKGSPGHVWTPDVGERAAGSVPCTPISGRLVSDQPTAPPSEDRGASSVLDRPKQLWDGVWPFFQAILVDQVDSAGSTTEAAAGELPVAFPAPTHAESPGKLWTGVWPIFESTSAVRAPTRHVMNRHIETDQQMASSMSASKSVKASCVPIQPVILSSLPLKQDVRSTVVLTQPMVSTQQNIPVSDITKVKPQTSPAEQGSTDDHDSLFAGTMFAIGSPEGFSVASQLSTVNMSPVFDFDEVHLTRSPSPAHLSSKIRPRPPLPPAEPSRVSQRVSGLPQVRPASQATTISTSGPSQPMPAWKAPWDPSTEPPLPPLPDPSARPRSNHQTSSTTSSLYQTPGPSTTTFASMPMPLTPKRPFKRLSRSLSSVSSFSEGGVDLKVPLNSPRRLERPKRVSQPSSPTEFDVPPDQLSEDPGMTSVAHIGVAIVYPSFDIYPSSTASPVDLGVTVIYPEFNLYPCSRPTRLSIGVSAVYPEFDICPEVRSRPIDIGVAVAYPFFDLYPSLRPSPINIGIRVVYPLFDIYPPAPVATVDVSVGVVIRYPNMTIYPTSPGLQRHAEGVTIIPNPVVYPQFDIYPVVRDPSAAVAVIPIVLYQYQYPSIIVYPQREQAPWTEPRARAILAPSERPNTLEYPPQIVSSGKPMEGVKITLCAFEYPRIVLYPKVDSRSQRGESVSILLSPFDYPRMVLYPPRAALHGSTEPVEIVLCHFVYPVMTIYPIGTPQSIPAKPVLHKLDTTPVTSPPPRRSGRSQTVSTINSIDFLKTPESTTSTLRTLSHLPSPNLSPESPELRAPDTRKATIPDFLPLQRFTKHVTSPFEALSEAHQSLTHQPVQRTTIPARSTYVPQSRPKRQSQADLFWAGVTGQSV